MEPSIDLLYKSRREEMVANQIEKRGILEERLLDAMRTLPRHCFIPEEYRIHAYADHPVPIGESQTISQPYIVALMTSLLDLKGWETVLEVGTGSGYQAALLGMLAREVHSVEIIPSLAEQARKNLKTVGIRNVFVHAGDGTLGWAPAAPYDAILVTAAAPDSPPSFFDQLKPEGRMVIPVGGRGVQELLLFRQARGTWKSENILIVAFVPLRGQWGWSRDDWPI